MSGRVLDAVVHLMDRQVVDPDDRMVCNVDDLELTFPDDGGPPYVSAILAGPAALAPRIGGPFTHWFGEKPGRVSFGVVDEVGSRVRIALHRDEVPQVTRVDDWIRDNVIAHLPGADHASE
jgi:hypothetical protein